MVSPFIVCCGWHSMEPLLALLALGGLPQGSCPCPASESSCSTLRERPECLQNLPQFPCPALRQTPLGLSTCAPVTGGGVDFLSLSSPAAVAGSCWYLRGDFVILLLGFRILYSCPPNRSQMVLALYPISLKNTQWKGMKKEWVWCIWDQVILWFMLQKPTPRPWKFVWSSAVSLLAPAVADSSCYLSTHTSTCGSPLLFF